MDTKAIVITGTTPGIGAAVARQLSTEGHCVLLAPWADRLKNHS
jgi:NADP-dependent 3-hydroxy acid dehydrogenase YdfG